MTLRLSIVLHLLGSKLAISPPHLLPLNTEQLAYLLLLQQFYMAELSAGLLLVLICEIFEVARI